MLTVTKTTNTQTISSMITHPNHRQNPGACCSGPTGNAFERNHSTISHSDGKKIRPDGTASRL